MKTACCWCCVVSQAVGDESEVLNQMDFYRSFWGHHLSFLDKLVGFVTFDLSVRCSGVAHLA